METIQIRARCFGGLLIDIDARGQEILGCFFSSSGNRIPDKMYMKLTSNRYDMDQIKEELEQCHG